MKKKYVKSKYTFYVKNSINDFLRNNKKIIIIFSLVFLLSFFTALLTSIKSADGLTLFNLTDKALKSYLKGSNTLFSLWFSKLINCIFYIVCIYLFSFNKWLICADFVLMGYFVFIFTVNSCVLIIIYGISAVLFAFVIYFILNIILFAFFVVLICYFNQMNCNKIRFPQKCNFGIVLLLILITFTIQIILTPIFSATIIIIS